MLRGKVASIVVAGVGVCALLVAASTAQAGGATGGTTCEGGFTFAEIRGNLTVPAGSSCSLDFTTVDGNVSVGSGADFTALAARITQNLSSEGANSVSVLASEVDGNASFDATSGTSTPESCGSGVSVCLTFAFNPGTPNPHPNGPANKFGNVSITNTSPAEAAVAGNFVGHDLTCTGNASVTNIAFEIAFPNTVAGQVFGQCVGL